MATEQAVNLTQLNLHQLDQIKSQIEEEVNFLTASMQQLKMVQQKLKDSKESLASITVENAGKSMLVPLTSSMYVPGKLKDGLKVLVDIGTGYYVQKTTKGAEEFFQRKMDYVTQSLEKVQKGFLDKHKIREDIVSVMQRKLQAHLQRPQ